MEPVYALEDVVPVKVSRGSFLNGGVCTVIDADAAALRSALLVEVDAHAVAAAGDLAGVNAVAAQAVHSRLADGMGGQFGDVGHVDAVVGQRHSHVGLAAAEGELQMVGLNKTLVVIGLQTNHQFAEGDNFLRHVQCSPL